MASCKVWDVVKVRFPYTERSTKQRRPALVVAALDTPGPLALLWVLMVTSASNRGWPGDVTVSDLDMAGLPAPSVVRAAKLATIESGDAEWLGQLPPGDRLHVAGALRQSLGQALTD